MKRASASVFIAFVIYWFAVAAAGGAVLRFVAPLLNLSVAVIAVTLRMLIQSKAAKTAFLVFVAVNILAVVISLFSERLKRRKRYFSFVRSFLFIIYFCYGFVFILFLPFFDNVWTLIAFGILVLVRATETRLMPREGASTIEKPSLLVRAVPVVWFLTAASAGAVVSRANLWAVGGFVALISVYDGINASREVSKGKEFKVSPARRAFFILAGVAALGTHAFLTAPPDFCRNWRPAGNTRMISQKRDAFDVITAGNHIYMGFKDGKLLKIPLKKQEGRDDTAEEIVAGNSAQRMAYSRRYGLLYVAAWKSEPAVIIVEPDSFRRVGEVSLPGCAATTVVVDDSRGRLFISCESAGRVAIADARTGRVILVKNLPRPANVYSIALGKKALYAVCASLDPYLYALNPDTLDIEKRTWIGFSNQGIALGEPRETLYVARLLASKIAAVSTKSMKMSGAFPAGLVVRDVQAAGSGRILAGDYVSGTARMINVRDRRTEEVWKLAPRVRGVWYDSETGRSFAACACGVYELK